MLYLLSHTPPKSIQKIFRNAKKNVCSLSKSKQKGNLIKKKMYYKSSCFLFCVVFYNASCSTPLYLHDNLHTLSWHAQNKHWHDNQTRHLCLEKKGYNTGHQEEGQDISCGYGRKDHKILTLPFATLSTSVFSFLLCALEHSF